VVFAPSRANDEAFVRSWARFERRAVSPGAMRKIIGMILDTDVRHVLSSVRVPTLVVHRIGDRATRVEGGRYLAANIAGAKIVEVPGADHFPWVGDTDAILDEVEQFVTGFRRGAEPDRILVDCPKHYFPTLRVSTRRARSIFASISSASLVHSNCVGVAL
jgi:hypothetical protein